MEITCELNEATTTQAKLARYLGLSRARISQLLEEKIIVRDETDEKGRILVLDSVRNYYLSQRSESDGSVNFWKEKGLHERAKRQLAELKLEMQRGELYEAGVVESVMVEHLTNFRTRLMGIPSKVAGVLPEEVRAEVYEIMTLEIEGSLKELAENYKSADLTAEL